MAKTVFVTDLDGTFMRDDKTISKYSIDLCNRLIREGICITYATARSQSSATQITKGIDFDRVLEICKEIKEVKQEKRYDYYRKKGLRKV